LITSSVFHYEIEFIHPFADGNGRMGRLWQTLMLSRWKNLFLFLPVESVIRDRQQAYYDVLAESDHAGNSTKFVEFMLSAILKTINDIDTDQVSDQVSDQVKALLHTIRAKTCSSHEIMTALGLSHRTNFRQHYLHPALDGGLIEMTIPEKPTSRLQKYRVTDLGKKFLSKE